MHKIYNSHNGFTLIELIIVVTISMIVIVIAGNLVSGSAVSEKNLTRISYIDVMNKLEQALKNASTGYGGLSVTKSVKDDVNSLPENYVAYFQSDNINSDKSGKYFVLQTQERDGPGVKYTRVIEKNQYELQNPGLFLKKITAKRNDSDPGDILSNIAIEFKNPVGNTSFYINNNNFVTEGNILLGAQSSDTINEFPSPIANTDYTLIELEFDKIVGDPSKAQAFTMKIYKDKQFYIELN